MIGSPHTLSVSPDTRAQQLAAMAALARAFPATHLHVIDLPYRFSSWALDDPRNVALWFGDAGQLQAWAVMQTPFWTVDYACHPHAVPDLHRQVLGWAGARAHQLLGTPFGLPSWYAVAFADRTGRIRDLEAAGFTCQAHVGEDSWSKVWMRRPAELRLPGVPIPEGFTLRPLAGEAEVKDYVELHRAAFQTRNMTVEWRARTLRSAGYVPDLDCVAVAPDGRLAAFCIGWLDRAFSPPRGQIEPMGVHPDYRHMGLGQALLAEVLCRLQAHGAAHVYVETDRERNAALALYQSLGFRLVREVLVYRKDYQGSSVA